MMDVLQTCKTCAFRSIQECRRYPPTIIENRSRKEWPHVDWNDWCGEWKAFREPNPCP